MSLETANARAEQRAAADKVIAHRKICAQCRDAFRARRPNRVCDAGFVLVDDLRLASAALAEQRALDSRPIAGQLPLFGQQEGLRL